MSKSNTITFAVFKQDQSIREKATEKDLEKAEFWEDIGEILVNEENEELIVIHCETFEPLWRLWSSLMRNDKLRARRKANELFPTLDSVNYYIMVRYPKNKKAL